MIPQSRKQFIQYSAAAGVAFLLQACGFGSGTKKPNTASVQSDGSKVSTTDPAKSSPAKFELIGKQDRRYNTLRQGFNKRIDKYPACIALCNSTDEVAAAMRYAREHKLTVSVKSGGHCMEGFSCNDGGLMINVSNMNQVQWVDKQTIKVGPGCVLSNLYSETLPQGRLLPGGSCGTVGIGGLTLGGGYGLFARKFGLTCDHLLEATMVDGMGNIQNTRHDPELLWALKGGGNGNFGVVTEMIFSTQIAPTHLKAHYFKAHHLNAERAASLLERWMQVAAQLPLSCFSGFVLNGSTLNILLTDYEHHDLQTILEPLIVLVDSYRSSHEAVLGNMLSNYYGRPGPLSFRNSSAGFFKGYSDVASYITEVFDTIIKTPGMIYQVNTLGGKINDAGFEKAASYAHRGYDFISELQSYWTTSNENTRSAAATSDILKRTADHHSTRQYVNYCSLEFADWEHAYYGEQYSRLQGIKRRYDPDNVIAHPQSIKV